MEEFLDVVFVGPNVVHRGSTRLYHRIRQRLDGRSVPRHDLVEYPDDVPPIARSGLVSQQRLTVIAIDYAMCQQVGILVQLQQTTEMSHGRVDILVVGPPTR